MNQRGERGFIARLAGEGGVPSLSRSLDDAAEVEIPTGATLVALSTDRGPASIARALGLAGTEVDGRLAAVATISDLLASGSTPHSIVLAMSAPLEADEQELLKASHAFADTCSQYCVAYVGGDTKRGPWGLVSTGIGFAETELFHRNRGRPGDLILVMGQIGDFVASLLTVTQGHDYMPKAEALSVLSKPRIPLEEAVWVRENLQVRSSTDASDGVFDAITNVLSNGCGALIHEDQLPLSRKARCAADVCAIHPTALLSAAGDWNQVAAVDPEGTAARVARAPNHLNVRIIGEVTANPTIRNSDVTGKLRRLHGISSDHFKTRFEDHADYLRHIAGLRPTGVE